MELKPKRYCFKKKYVFDVTNGKEKNVKVHKESGNRWIKYTTFFTGNHEVKILNQSSEFIIFKSLNYFPF